MIEWANELPQQHFLPIDHNLHGAEADKPQVRTVVHVHGAKVRPEYDGYPEDWVVPGKSNLYYYPNQQDPAMLWYHDHAMGINRLNIFAGLLGSYIVQRQVEDALNLPNGKYEIPLLIFDRDFTLDHQLLYPISGNADAPWVPEVYGESILANGKLFPYCDVEPRKYRFRLLNAFQQPHLSLLVRRRRCFSSDRHRPGTAAGTCFAEEAGLGACRARRHSLRLRRTRRREDRVQERQLQHRAVPGFAGTR